MDTITLSYHDTVASGVETEAIDTVPLNPDWLPADTHPGYVRFRLDGYREDKGSSLPYPSDGPQLMVYRTEEFAAFGGDPTGFSQQLQALSALLDNRPDRSTYVAKAVDRGPQHTPSLPFLYVPSGGTKAAPVVP